MKAFLPPSLLYYTNYHSGTYTKPFSRNMRDSRNTNIFWHTGNTHITCPGLDLHRYSLISPTRENAHKHIYTEMGHMTSLQRKKISKPPMAISGKRSRKNSMELPICFYRDILILVNISPSSNFEIDLFHRFIGCFNSLTGPKNEISLSCLK